jgi:hypothetical protein
MFSTVDLRARPPSTARLLCQREPRRTIAFDETLYRHGPHRLDGDDALRPFRAGDDAEEQRPLRRRELLGNRFYCCVLVAQHKKSFENT